MTTVEYIQWLKKHKPKELSFVKNDVDWNSFAKALSVDKLYDNDYIHPPSAAIELLL